MQIRSTALGLAVAAALGAALPATLIATAPVALADGRGCPPGLAKKSPSCVPPGQARKGVGERDWRGDDRDEVREWRIRRDGSLVAPWGEVYYPGDRLPDVVYIDRNAYPGLPALPGDRGYALLGNQIVEVVRATDRLIRVWDALGR